jgi:hypothetical protein
MLYYFGELYNLLEEEKYDFKKDKFLKKKMKAFAGIRSRAFSAGEASMSLEVYNDLYTFTEHLLNLAEEYNLLEKYGLTREDYPLIKL